MYDKHVSWLGPRESEFFFLETLDVPRGKAEGNIEVDEGKSNSLFPSLSVLLYLPTQNYKKLRRCWLA